MGRFAYLSAAMTGSRQTDGDLLARARDGLWELQDLHQFRAGLLSLLGQLVDCDSASYNEIGHEPGELYVLAEPAESLQVDVPLELFGEMVSQNPLAAHYRRTGDCSALRMSDFISCRGLHALELYDVFYRQLGVEFQLAFTLPGQGQLIGVTLNRAGRDFSERDLARLEGVRRHVLSAHRNLRDRARLDMLARAVDGHHEGPVAVLLLEQSGVLHAAHERAERLLARIARDGSAMHALRSWAHLQRIRATDGAVPLRLDVLGSDLQARFLHGASGTPDAIALSPCASRRPQSLRALGLTQRQAEVLHLIWLGSSNADIAHTLGISEHTVRHHLEDVFRRLDVSSRTAAAHLAGRALAGRGAEGVLDA
jgi:DNA-binding CsgD family transcriptional regulator